MRKQKVKIAVDAAMLLLLLYLMSYRPGTGLLLHAEAGLLAFLLFVLHHLLNLNWYRSLRKGRYTFRRRMLTACDLLLLADMLLMMGSAFLIAGRVFPVSFFMEPPYWRDIHAAAAAWGLLLTAFHLGLHLHSPLVRLEGMIKQTAFEYAFYLLELLSVLWSVFGFLQSGLWQDLWMLPHGDGPLSALGRWVSYAGILLGVCILLHGLLLLTTKHQAKKRGGTYENKNSSP